MTLVRSLAVAAIFIFSVAASPNVQRDQPTEHPADSKVASALESIALSLKQASEPNREAADCPKGEEDRKSELCAQWKAADAADSSVLIALCGLIVGIITMGAAIGAAVFAKSAATHTRDGANAARDAVELSKVQHAVQTRAYMTLLGLNKGKATDSVIDGVRGDYLVIGAQFKNVGSTPALNCSVLARFSVGEKAPIIEDADQGTGGPVFPQTEVASQYCYIPLDVARQAFLGNVTIFVYFGFFYNDVFSDERRKTVQCFPISVGTDPSTWIDPSIIMATVSGGSGGGSYSETN